MKVILKISLRKEGRERAREFRSQIKPHSLSSTVPLAQALHNFHCIDLLLQRCGRVPRRSEIFDSWPIDKRKEIVSKCVSGNAADGIKVLCGVM